MTYPASKTPAANEYPRLGAPLPMNCRLGKLEEPRLFSFPDMAAATAIVLRSITSHAMGDTLRAFNLGMLAQSGIEIEVDGVVDRATDGPGVASVMSAVISAHQSGRPPACGTRWVSCP